MGNNGFDRFTRELESLRAALASRSSAPQLAHSSFDSGPGHSIDEMNPETGQPVSSYGTQFDGSHGAVPFTGPIPPTPTGAITGTAPGVLSAGWDGNFAGENGAPDITIPPTLDFTHVEVHADQNPAFTADQADTIIGTVNTPRGGLATAVVPAGTWWVRLVARSAAGKRSPASPAVSVVVPNMVDTASIEMQLDAANELIESVRDEAMARVIGTDFIATGAVTAPKITASEELTAKVAQFLEVTADMVKTNELWADAAWLAAASTHILTVLSNTNGDGYTSTVTGQGIRVTKMVDGTPVDVIRLGTFGKDFISVSDGAGRALAAITGDGEIGTQYIYSDGDVYSNGRKIGDTVGDMAKGERVFGAHLFVPGNTPSGWSTTSTSGAGIIEVAFEAEPGRAYQLVGNLKWWAGSNPAKAAFQAVYTVGNTVPTINSTNKITPAGNGVETPLMDAQVWTSVDFGGRFVPIALTQSPTQNPTTRVRVLLWAKRMSGTGTVSVESAQMQINDVGFPGPNYLGFPNGTGSSNLPDVATTTETFAPELVTRWRASAVDGPNFMQFAGNNTDPFKVGDMDANGRGWKAAVRFNANSWLNTRLASVVDVSMKLRFKPTLFPQGMGTIHFGVSPILGAYLSTPLPPPEGTEWHPQRQFIAGAWSAGVTREFPLPRNFVEWYVKSGFSNLYWWFGGTAPNAGINRDPRYATLINPADIQLEVTTTKKV